MPAAGCYIWQKKRPEATKQGDLVSGTGGYQPWQTGVRARSSLPTYFQCSPAAPHLNPPMLPDFC